MITIEIRNPDRGSRRVFPDEASAIVWVQDEIARWEKALGPNLQNNPGAYAEPLVAWRHIKDDIDGFRRRGRKQPSAKEYFLGDETDRLVEINSPYGKSLMYVLNNLGVDSASAAAIYYRIADGELDWGDNVQFRGVMLFETILNSHRQFIDDNAERSSKGKLENISDRIDQINGSIAKIDEMIASVSATVLQQRSEVDAEWTTYKAEITEDWRKLAEEAKRIEAANKSAVAAAQSQFAGSMQDAQTKLDGWIAAQGEQRQLEKPAALWSQRAVTHAANADRWKNWSIIVGFAGLGLAIAVAVLTFLCSRPLFEAAIIEGASDNAKAVAGTLRPTFHYELIFTGAITLVWLTMYLWAMRVLVRLYTTEHHLAIDASARGAMMEAYLGLIEAKAANKADRPIVLQALFRPVQDGMVRDDGPPGITPAALLSSLASAKGGNN